MPLFLRDADVRALLTPRDAVATVASAIAAGVEPASRSAQPLAGGSVLASAGRAPGGGLAGVSASVWSARGGRDAIILAVSLEDPRVEAVLEARWLAGLRAGATAAVAAERLAGTRARSLGVIGCGDVAAATVACLRETLPDLERVVAYARTPARVAAFCAAYGAERADYGREAAEQDLVVTATSSRDPVLRGDWLRPGALVLALGARALPERELDNAVLERATFVCCDSVVEAHAGAADLVEPVARGVLDWLEVHELGAVVSGELDGRQRDDDVVVVKVVGPAGLDLALAQAVLARADAAAGL